MNNSDLAARLERALRHDRDAAPDAPTREQLYALAVGTQDAVTVTRNRRTGWQRALLAAAVIAAVTTGTSLYLDRGDGNERDSHPARSTSARQFLLTSARIVTAVPFTAPRADQVDYARTADASAATIRTVDGRLVTRPGHVDYTQLWSPQTPGRTGLVRTQGQRDLPYMTLANAFPLDLSHYAGLLKLPTDDPKQLLADIASNVGNAHVPGDDTTVDAMKVMVHGGFFEQVLPPSLAAAVYTALAADPRVTQQDGTADVLGRPAVAVGVTDAQDGRWEVLFDARTHQPIGTRYWTSKVGRSSGFDDEHVRAGRYDATAIVQVATVDRVGQTPGR